MSLPDPKNLKMNIHFSDLPSSSTMNTHLVDSEALERMQRELDSFDSSLETFAYMPYRDECLRLTPLWVFEEASPDALFLFRKITAWDEKNQTLVMKIYDYEGKLVSIKRWHYRGGKWMTYKGTHPNRQCLMRINNKLLPIFVIEGNHDGLSAILLDIDDIITFNFITIQTAGYKAFGEVELKALAGRNVYFLPDLGDKDETGIRCMTRLAEQVEHLASNTRVVNLRKFLEENSITVESDKLDLSDALFLWNEGSYAFINKLLYYCDRGIVYEGEVF